MELWTAHMNPGPMETPVTRPSKRDSPKRASKRGVLPPRRGRFPATPGRLGSTWGTCKSQVASAVSWLQKQTGVWVWWREGWRTLFWHPGPIAYGYSRYSDIDMFVWFGWLSRYSVNFVRFYFIQVVMMIENLCIFSSRNRCKVFYSRHDKYSTHICYILLSM